MPNLIQEAHAHLNTVRQGLLAPNIEPLNSCAHELEQAIACLRTLELELSGAFGPGANERDFSARSDVVKFKSELDTVILLLAQGMQFHAGWASMLASATSGYTAQGASAPLAARGQIAVEG